MQDARPIRAAYDWARAPQAGRVGSPIGDEISENGLFRPSLLWSVSFRFPPDPSPLIVVGFRWNRVTCVFVQQFACPTVVLI
jgi:hypothetical protein